MSLRSKIPSTGSLFVFEAAARLGSFTGAAQAFNVTQPAVSRTIGTLERHLGYKLFNRQPSGLELTTEGAALFQAVQAGFGQIELVIDDQRKSLTASNVVTLSITSAFAIHWLMPRLAGLNKELPDVSLRFELIHGEPDGPLGSADIGIRYAWEETAGVTVFPVMDELIIPVCSPDYLAKHGKLETSRDGEGHFLAVLSGPMRVPWNLFLERVGLPPMTKATRMEFSDYALLLQSAIKGQCIGLGWWHVVGGELEGGGLMPASSKVLEGENDYCLVTRGAAGEQRDAVRRVVEWLTDEFCTLRTHTRTSLGLD